MRKGIHIVDRKNASAYLQPPLLFLCPQVYERGTEEATGDTEGYTERAIEETTLQEEPKES